MTAPTEYTYNVFVSYSQADREWVAKELFPRLKESGLRIYDPAHDSELGSHRIVSVDQAIEHSRKILLILTPEWLADEWAQLQGLLVQFHDLSGYARRIVPVLLKPCKLPSRLAILNYADFTNNTDSKSEWERLLKTVGTRARIWIEFDRQNKSDTHLAQKISTHLRLAGHDTAMDMNIKIGRDYMLGLQEQINSNDFIIILLSNTAISNEIFRQLIYHAYWRNKSHTKPVLLPVRFKYVQTLPHPLSIYLGSLQYAEWRPRSKQGLQKLVNQLLDAIIYGKTLQSSPAYNAIPEISITPEVLPSHMPSTKIATQTDRTESNLISEVSPLPSADPRFITSLLTDPGGALNPLDILYIERKADQKLRNQLQKPRGITATIRGSRQSGKSSLLIRASDYAKLDGIEVVFIDLQPIDDVYLQSPDKFFRFFVSAIINDLSLDLQKIDHFWQQDVPETTKVTKLIKEYILPSVTPKLMLAIDEADRVWRSPVSDSFFSMLRSWTNQRAFKNEDWYKFILILVISTEPNLLIEDISLSPFVGTRIDLDDFTSEQIFELNLRYGSQLQVHELPQLIELLGGHPYLSSKALYLLANKDLDWPSIQTTATNDRGPFSDHLRRYWWMLRDKPSLVEALKSVLKHGRCSYEAFHRLSSAGLLIGDNGTPCSFRCKLYEDYFRKSLQ